MGPVTRSIQGRWLGRQRYEPVLKLQRELVFARQQGQIQDTVLFVEHEPVITLGRGTNLSNLLASKEALREINVDLVAVERGGDVTLHAPGQLVCYPILDLHPDRCDVRRYVKDLARVMCGVIREHGIDGGLVDGLVGLWLDQSSPAVWPGQESAKSLAKIGAIGVRLSRWVTMHGFALNLATDLRLFNLIIPCGIKEHPVTTLLELTGQTVTVAQAARAAYAQFSEVFEAELTGLSDESEQPLMG